MIDEARQLYALPPGEFIAERNRTAKALKADGRTDDAAFVAGLRRPKLAEYALNRVAHHDRALVVRVVDAAEAASKAQSAAIGGAKTSLREATAELREATRSAVDAAVQGLNDSGASGEGQRDEIGELLRGLLAGSGSSQLLNGVVGYEGVIATDDLFAGAPDPPDTIRLDAPERRAAPKKAPAKIAAAPALKKQGAKKPEPAATTSTRAQHLARQEERARLLRRQRETGSAVDDAERQLAIATRELNKVQRQVDRAQAVLDKAQATADAARQALDDYGDGTNRK